MGMKPPLIDELYSALLQQDAKALEEISRERPEEAVHIRTLVSTTDKGAGALHIDMSLIRAEAPWMTSILEGPRFFFLSRHIAAQKLISGSSSSLVAIDWSFSFDSNVAEKVRAYIYKKNIDNKELSRVLTLLRLKKRHSIQVDMVPFLSENLRLARENPTNKRPLKTIASFRSLDHLDWDAFENNPFDPQLNKNLDELEHEASGEYESFISNRTTDSQEIRAIFNNAFLLKLAEEWIRDKDDNINTFSKLIDFCIFDLGKMPVYELGLAWDFLCNPKGLRFFGPLADVSIKLADKLRAMSWDLAHLRMLESMTTLQKVEGCFFIPIFVSFDFKLIELIDHNPIRFILIDDHSKRLQSGRVRDLETMEAINNSMSERARAAMSNKDRNSRRNRELNADQLKALVNEKEKILSDLISAK